MEKEYIWHYEDLKKIPKNGLTAFSCFSCGGGSSMGYKLAGYDLIGNCEIDPAINAMYVENHHPKYNFLMGVQDFYKEENLKNIPDELFHLDVLDGSPPCSTFSMAGQRQKNWGKEKKFREGQAKQVLSDLFFEFIKVAELLQPKVVISENVKGLVTGKAKGYVNEIRKEFDRIGYDTQIFLLNAATMGVPQARERVFFISRRKDLNLPPVKLEFNMKPIVYGEFADDSENCRPMNKDTVSYKAWCGRKPGDINLSAYFERTIGKQKMFCTSLIYRNRVLPTITAGAEMVRFWEPRFLSDRDIIIGSTFPIDYKFGKNNPTYVCGMSVPPFMMRGVAREVAKQIFGK